MRTIAKFEIEINGKSRPVEAVIENNFLTYWQLNKVGERAEAVSEGCGFMVIEKNEDQNFVYSGRVIDKSHYENPRQFLQFMMSFAKFIDKVNTIKGL